ncbi:hypothetical protein [Streptomyces sp. NPDC054784]
MFCPLPREDAMRPARFETWLRDLLQTSGAEVKSVATVKEEGYTRHPYGLVVTYRTGARVVLQMVGVAPDDGDDYSKPEAPAAEGEPPAERQVPELFDSGKVQLAAVDQHLAAVVCNSRSAEVSGVDVYSERETPGAVTYGLTARFHDTSKIFVYVVEAEPSGRELSGQPFNVPAAV